MASGCGLSRKFNRRVGRRFLYFWWYGGGRKRERYLGRVGDAEAEKRGLRLMLSFYRRQDEVLHRRIGELVERLTTGRRGGLRLSQAGGGPAYLPETED